MSKIVFIFLISIAAIVLLIEIYIIQHYLVLLLTLFLFMAVSFYFYYYYYEKVMSELKEIAKSTNKNEENFSSFPVVNSLYKNLHDHNKKHDEEIFKLCSILNLITTWHWEIDTKGTYTFISDGVKNVGFEPYVLSGVYFYSIASDVDVLKNQFLNIRENLNRNINLTYNIEYNEEKRHIQMVGVPFFTDGKLMGYHGVSIDKTIEKLTYNKMLYFQKMESVGTLCSGIGHDLKNIVQSISLNSALIEQNLNGDSKYNDVKTFIESINISSTHMIDVLKKLLVVAKGSNGDDFDELVFDAFIEDKVLPVLITPSSVELHVNLNCGSSIIYGDKTQMLQMIMNLFVNSCQSIERFGDVNISTHNFNNYVVFSIEDTGVGMTEEQQLKAFDAFYSNKEKGTGLGLYMVHEIVKKHGGYINIFSKKGEKTRFDVYIPKYKQGDKKIK